MAKGALDELLNFFRIECHGWLSAGTVEAYPLAVVPAPTFAKMGALNRWMLIRDDKLRGGAI
jgi:hypothetical protein